MRITGHKSRSLKVVFRGSLQLNNASNREGIRVSFSPLNYYRCNIVELRNTFRSGKTGILINSSVGNEFSCNYVDEQGYGFRFNGPAPNTILQGNEINDHTFGLFLSYDAVIGQQYNSGNKWNGVTSIGAYMSNMNAFSASNNQFGYNSMCSNCLPSNNGTNFNWFMPNSDDFYSCHESSSCQLNIQNDLQITHEDIDIASDSIFGQEFGETTDYFLKRYLFEKLEQDPSFLSNNPILQAFYNQNLYNSVGLYSKLETDIKEALKWEVIYVNVYELNEETINIQSLLVREIDSLLEWGHQEDSLITQRDLAVSLINSLLESNENIMSDLALIRETKLNDLDIENNNIPQSELYEENEQIVNEIFLETLARDFYTLSADQEDKLESIIVQCPFSGGPAVYSAISLYQMINDTLAYDEDLVCPSYGISPRIRKPIEYQFSVYPNPTVSTIQMKYYFGEEQDVRVVFTNTVGKVVREINVPLGTRELQVDLQDLPASIYNYKVFLHGEEFSWGKIVLIK